MAKRIPRYRIKERVSGSFVASGGRVRYALEPGIVSAKDVDPEVLARLVAAGMATAVSARPAKPTEGEDA